MLRFRMELLRDIAASGHEVVATTPDAPDASVEALARLGIRYEAVAFHPTGMNPLRDARDLLRMRAWMAAQRPDVFFGYGAKPASYGVLAAAAAGVPLRYAMLTGLGYAFVQDGTASSGRFVVRNAQSALYKAAFHWAHRVLVQNPDDLRELVARRIAPASRLALVPGSGVDTGHFAFSRAPTEPIRFVYVGRLLRSKGVHELVKAAGIVRASVPNAEIHLVGAVDPNPDRADEGLLRAAAARGDIVLHGHVDDVREILEAASVFVLPSYREGLPRSALEAMATGRTLIVADVPGSRELVRPGRHGFLVPAGDALALARAMIHYANAPARVIGEGAEARRTVESEYAIERVNRQMLGYLGL